MNPGDAFARVLHVLPTVHMHGGSQGIVRQRLARARKISKAAVRHLESTFGYLEKGERGVLVELFFAYRAVNDWDGMITLHRRLPPELAGIRTMLEQLAFALNRAGHGDFAERLILDTLSAEGPSSEAYGLLGRIQKDRWDIARREGRVFVANGLLDKAIDAYMHGVEADPRDIYPGINALTLMEFGDRSLQCRSQLLPVVRLAAEQRLASSTPDYWDHATLLEIAVLSRDEEASGLHLGNAIEAFREPWERQTTARNLSLLREAREARGEPANWVKAIEQRLLRDDAPSPSSKPPDASR